jgi:hypothetical protein
VSRDPKQSDRILGGNVQCLLALLYQWERCFGSLKAFESRLTVGANTYIFDFQGTVDHECIFKYNQQDAVLHNSFISVKCSACFRQFLCPSSGAQKLYIQHLVFVKPLLLLFPVVEELELQLLHKYQMLYIQFSAPDDGRRNCLKHVEHFAEIN